MGRPPQMLDMPWHMLVILLHLELIPEKDALATHH